MVIHVHKHLANNRWPKKLHYVWMWLMEKLAKYDAEVLMGDFGMALLMVAPELRSRGAQVDLGAWPPWTLLAGDAMTDSCGMLFLNMPGEYALYKNLTDLHGDHEGGLLARATSEVAPASRELSLIQL